MEIKISKKKMESKQLRLNLLQSHTREKIQSEELLHVQYDAPMEYTAATGALLSVGVMATAVQDINQICGMDIATNVSMHGDNFFAKQYKCTHLNA